MSTASNLDYVTVRDGVVHYNFEEISSLNVCRKIEVNCNDRIVGERFKAVAYLALSVCFSLFMGLSARGFAMAQIFTMYFFSSEALRRSNHYLNMQELVTLRIAEIGEQKWF